MFTMQFGLIFTKAGEISDILQLIIYINKSVNILNESVFLNRRYFIISINQKMYTGGPNA